jgi:hypothetical protein
VRAAPLPDRARAPLTRRHEAIAGARLCNHGICLWQRGAAHVERRAMGRVPQGAQLVCGRCIHRGLQSRWVSWSRGGALAAGECVDACSGWVAAMRDALDRCWGRSRLLLAPPVLRRCCAPGAHAAMPGPACTAPADPLCHAPRRPSLQMHRCHRCRCCGFRRQPDALPGRDPRGGQRRGVVHN